MVKNCQSQSETEEIIKENEMNFIIKLKEEGLFAF